MPIYHFQCEKCGATQDDFEHIQHPVPEPECCGMSMGRDYGGSGSVTGVFHKPIPMQSIGMAHQDEIDDFRVQNPGVEVSDDPDHPLFGVPLATTRQEKMGILRKMGWEEKK